MDLMAEALKELGPEVMNWGDQADLDNGCQTNSSFFASSECDALGFSEVYPTREFGNQGSTDGSQYEITIPSTSLTTGRTNSYDIYPGNGFNDQCNQDAALSSYLAPEKWQQVQDQNAGSHQNVQGQNAGSFHHSVGQTMHTSQIRRRQSLEIDYNSSPHVTAAYPREEPRYLLENAVDNELHYNGQQKVKPLSLSGQAASTDQMGRETTNNLTDHEGGSLDLLTLASMISKPRDTTNVKKRPLVSSLLARVPSRKVNALSPAPSKSSTGQQLWDQPFTGDLTQLGGQVEPVFSSKVAETSASLVSETPAFQITPLVELSQPEPRSAGQDATNPEGHSTLTNNTSSFGEEALRAVSSQAVSQGVCQESGEKEIFSAPISASVKDIVASKEEEGLMLSGLEEATGLLATPPVSTPNPFLYLFSDRTPGQVPLDYRRIYWAREVAFNRMHPVPSQAQHGGLKLSTHADSCHEKDATEEVKRSPNRTETLDAEVSSPRSSGRGEEEEGRNNKEEEKVEKSSSPETSPPASSSGPQTRQGKRKKTAVKTGYSFFCDEISPEVCQLLGVARNKRVAKNAMQAKWKALPLYEKSHYNQMSKEHEDKTKMETALEDKENEAPSLKKFKIEALSDQQSVALILKEDKQEIGDQQYDTIHHEEIAVGRAPILAEEEIDAIGSKFSVEDECGLVEVNEAVVSFDNITVETENLLTELPTSQGNTFKAPKDKDNITEEQVNQVEEEEEDSEEELERSLAAEMYEVTLEETLGIGNGAVVEGAREVAAEGEGESRQNKKQVYGEEQTAGQGEAEVDNVLQHRATEDDAARESLLQVDKEFIEAHQEEIKGKQLQVEEAALRVEGEVEENEFYWEEVIEDVGETHNGGIACGIVDNVARSGKPEDEQDEQEVEEVDCTLVKCGVKTDREKGSDTQLDQLEQRRLDQSRQLEKSNASTQHNADGTVSVSLVQVQDAIAEDSFWECEDTEGEQLREEVLHEGTSGKELREEVREELGMEGDQVGDLVTILVQECTVLNLDVVLEAPEIFNIPGNFKDHVPDEFSPTPAKKTLKGSKKRRSK